MLSGKTWDEWIAQYARSHQHPVNRFCHTIGIPLIAASLPLVAAAFFVEGCGRFRRRCSWWDGRFSSSAIGLKGSRLSSSATGVSC